MELNLLITIMCILLTVVCGGLLYFLYHVLTSNYVEILDKLEERVECPVLLPECIQLPPIQLPPEYIQLPPVQLPPVQLPPVQLPPVQLPPVPSPPEIYIHTQCE